MLNVIYAGQPIELKSAWRPFQPNSLFLAGPTPRSKDVPSWRPEALSILESLNYPATVFVPERNDWEVKFEYEDQVEWEHTGLENASLILFWVPRELKTMPGFITNVEFGRYVDSGRCLYGRPDDAPKNRYLDWMYEKYTSLKPLSTLSDLLETAINLLKAN